MDLTRLERYAEIVDDWGAMCAALARPLPYCVWANTLRHVPEDVSAWLTRCAVAHEPVAWTQGVFKTHGEHPPLGTSLPFLTGMMHIQEEVSIIPSLLLGARPGERVLDMCCAPGGKTAHLAVMMENRGTLVANDKSYGRLRALRSIIDRLGLLNVVMTSSNAANLPGEVGTFDRVLADVPCSCEGTSRKHPKILRDTTPLERPHRLQRAILRRALELVRPGGRVVYSTCTYAPEENEMVVEHALSSLEEGYAEIAEISLPGFTFAQGLTQWGEETFRPSMARTMRVYPHLQDTGGFFVAVLERRA